MRSLRHSTNTPAALAAGSVILAAMFAPTAAAGSRIAVHPPRAEILAGETFQFETETSFDGKTRWEVIPPRLGYVDGTGTFLAGNAAGKGIVRVIHYDGAARLIGHAVVIVAPNNAAAPVAMLPQAAELRPGEEITFALIGGAPGGGPSYRWAVDPPGLGHVTDQGRFRAGQRAGEGRVFAFLPDDPAGRMSATIRIVPDGGRTAIIDARIVPPVATVPVGEEVRFTIPGISSGASVTWSVIPPRIGIITPDGVFRSSPYTGLSLDEIFRHEGTIVATVQSGDQLRELRAHIVIGTSDLPARIEIDPPAFRTVVSPLQDFSPQPIRFRVLAENASATSELAAEWRVVPEGVFDVQPRFGERTWLRWVGPQDGNAPIQSLSVRVEARVSLPNGRVIVGSAPIEVRVIQEHFTLTITPRNVITTVGSSVPLRPAVTSMSGVSVPIDELLFEGTVIPADLGTFQRSTGVFLANRAGAGRIIVRATSARFPALFAKAEVGVLVREKTDTGGGSGR